MSISSQLKFKMENERNAAIQLERALKGVKVNLIDTFEDIRSGAERTSWYGSCFFDKYKDVCSGLLESDKRFIFSIKEIYKRKDVIRDMMDIYISLELDKAIGTNNLGYVPIFNKNSGYKTTGDKIRDIDRKLAGFLSNYASGKLGKIAVANSLSILVVESFSFKNKAMKIVSGTSMSIITWFSLYGKVQNAERKANEIKVINRGFYDALYKNGLEMLYFIIDPAIKGCEMAAASKVGEDRFITIIKSLFR